MRIILVDNLEALTNIDGLKREQIPEFKKGLNTVDCFHNRELFG